MNRSLLPLAVFGALLSGSVSAQGSHTAGMSMPGMTGTAMSRAYCR